MNVLAREIATESQRTMQLIQRAELADDDELADALRGRLDDLSELAMRNGLSSCA
ncbi:MAG TPA: hypothetical protein VFJ17_00845 [Mycobacteriales bacterium]|nr:hypothetical protein [Mycobacteriales bacterium]